MKFLWSLLFCASIFWTLAIPVANAEGFGLDITEADPDIDKVEFYLHTVDVGRMVYDNFGHTAIRVVDKRNLSDRVFNWGMFDFGNPITFSVEFYKGNLNYKLGAYPTRFGMRMYSTDTRSVWEEPLLLSPIEKTRLLRRLEWNLRPQNVYYSYQYFFDNCATRPRDYLDEALGGALRTHFEKVTSPFTFRDFVMDAYQMTPGMDVLLDFGMNSNIDRFASAWEAMFHPLHLRSALREFSEKQRPLLGKGTTLFEHTSPDTYPKLAYSFLLIFGGVPLIPIGVLLFIQQDKVQPSKWLYRSFGALASVWLFFGGFFGFLMTLSWAISGHQDLHHNANQLLCWPIDGIFFLLALLIFIKGRPLVMKTKFYHGFRVLLMIHILVSLLLPLLYVAGVIEQNVGRVSIYLLPPYVTILLLLFRVGLRDQRDYQLAMTAKGNH